MEKIEYFLFLKKHYENILLHLNEINNTYEEIISSDKVSDNISDNVSEKCLGYDYTLQKDCQNHISKINLCIQKINTSIWDNCNHNFIDDEIDITPERSKKITYCSLCEYTVN